MFSLFSKNTFESINVSQLDELLNTIELIDIRETYEYKSGHIPTAKNIPMGQLLSDPDKYLKKEKTYYIVCQSGGRSSSTCSKLKSGGFNVINVTGGTGGYRGMLKK